ncbi:MAG TPA: EAL domain-containing protein [Solirubrobacteraceae bacterium]|nr:EAL domain-containing protein [Solirubrobacteraceae bacterium]
MTSRAASAPAEPDDLRVTHACHVALLESALDAIVTMGADGIVLEWNPAAERTFGYARADAVGRELAELIVPPEMRDAHRAGLGRHIATGEHTLLGRRLELTAVRADGIVLPVELTITRSDVEGRTLFTGVLRNLTEARKAEAALRESERRFRTLVEQLPCVTYECAFDAQGSIRYISPLIETWTGRSVEEWTGDPEIWHRMVHPADRERVVAAIEHSHSAVEAFECEYRLICKDGRELTVWDCDQLVLGDDGAPTHSQGIMVDVSALRSAEAALRDTEQQLQATVSAAPLTLTAFDLDGVMTLATGKGLEGLGATRAELEGHSVFDVFHDVPQVVADCRRALTGESFSSLAEIDGHDFACAYEPVFDDRGTLKSVIVVATDVTEQRRDEAQILHLAYHDQLTGLPNRARFEEELERALGLDGRLAVLHLALDDLALIADGLGHATSEALIRELALRLRAALPPDALLAHPHGEAFLVLLERLGEDAQGDAEAVVAALQATVRAPVQVAGAEVQVTMSAGIALCPQHGDNAAELLRHAKVALRQRRQGARGSCRVYRAELDDAHRRLTLAGRLRLALAADRFELHYQPLVELAGGETVGVEALLRWNDPEEGMIPPGDFIPVAESSGLIHDLGEWVLDAACRQVVAWDALGLSPDVAVNVSPLQLRRTDFTSRLLAVVERHGVAPRRLVLEITESAAMEEPGRTKPLLREFRRLGFRVAIDDFGAQHSSLGRLSELAVDVLKIDRHFLVDVPQRSEASAICVAMIELAGALGMTAVAEGIETAEQYRFLADRGCPFGQGFGIARPMPVAMATAHLTRARDLAR